LPADFCATEDGGPQCPVVGLGAAGVLTAVRGETVAYFLLTRIGMVFPLTTPDREDIIRRGILQRSLVSASARGSRRPRAF